MGSLGWDGYRAFRPRRMQTALPMLDSFRDVPISVTLTVRVTARKASVELK